MFSDIEPVVLKRKMGHDLNLLPGLIDKFNCSSLTYIPTISTNIHNVEKKCQDSQVCCCKKLQFTKEWQILQGLASRTI